MIIRICIILIACLVGCQNHPQTENNFTTYFEGVSNNGTTQKEPYLTAGDKAYIIGTQNGLFPDLGGHVRGEMGGIWTHPIKLADGFWARISEESNPEGIWLMESDEYITYPHGSKFIYRNRLNNLHISRFQLAPNQEKGVIISYTIQNNSGNERNIILDFVLKTDISPVWFSKENGILDSPDLLTWDNNNKLFLARDSIHDWYMTWGSNYPTLSYQESSPPVTETLGQGKSGSIRTSLKIQPKGEATISFAISGSTNSSNEAIDINHRLLSKKDKLIQEKQSSFNSLLKKSKISIPDKQLETAYNWIKINTRWLEMELEGYGRFLGAGAIEYPWLFGCDNSYALQGVLATGNFDLAKSTLTMLKDVSEKTNGDGRIIHEMSTNGYVYNKGNTQETAHFIVAVWKTFLWTGDKEFLQNLYPYIKKGIHWLTVDMDTNQNLFPEGYGIMEVKGLNAELIDVSVYTQQALEVTSKMATMFNDMDLSYEYAAKAKALKEKINNEFWEEKEGIYCDFFGTRQQAISVAQGAIGQLRMNDSDLNKVNILFYENLLSDFEKYEDNIQKGWFTNKNWVINTPMETAIAPKEKAILCLNKIRDEHCGEYGPYLSAVEKDRMMTISTGVQAVSEAQYGRIDKALWYMNRIAATLSRTLPGSINEMMPDYGCPVQAWTIYGIAVPLVNHIFGVTPNAANRQTVIKPNLPSDWPNAMIENLAVGTNIYTIKIEKEAATTSYTILSTEKGWQTTLVIKGLVGKKYTLNGDSITATSDSILLEGTNNTITVGI